eukprot:SM000005S17126  [mRNA]  locus=s5:376739:380388:+ [translate_table: standard]
MELRRLKPFRLLAGVVVLLCISALAEAKDLYKVLGVEKDASDRDIKKAYHKQSLKYHPDKNPSKAAQAKFMEISNAYEVLSDEDKRKQYDMFGEAGLQGGPRTAGSDGPGRQHQHQYHEQSGHGFGGGFPGGSASFSAGDFGGFSSFFGGGGGGGGKGSKRSFQFDFGSGGGMGGLFGDLFGQAARAGQSKQQRQHAHSGHQHDHQARGGYGFQDALKSVSGAEQLNRGSFGAKVLSDEHLVWLVLFHAGGLPEATALKVALEGLVRKLKAMVKVGVVDCGEDRALCAQYNTYGSDFVFLLFPYGAGNGEPLTYVGAVDADAMKEYCFTQLPNFSKHRDVVGMDRILARPPSTVALAVLFTDKPETPALWRHLSGSLRDQLQFFDVEVGDVVAARSVATTHGVQSVPAVMGFLPDGRRVPFSGDLKLTALREWLEQLAEQGKGCAASAGASQQEAGEVPWLSVKNFEEVCGSGAQVCIVALVASAHAGDGARQLLGEVSQIRSNGVGGRRSAAVIHYGLVDAGVHRALLRAFPGVTPPQKPSQVVVLAYKAKRHRYAVHEGATTVAALGNFVSAVLDGDVHFQNVNMNFRTF